MMTIRKLHTKGDFPMIKKKCSKNNKWNGAVLHLESQTDFFCPPLLLSQTMNGKVNVRFQHDILY